MKRFFLKTILLLSLVCIASCNEEKETVGIEENLEQSEFERFELPKGVINATELLEKNGIKNSSFKRKSTTVKPKPVYKKYYVLFSYEWSSYERFRFLQKVKARLGVDIFVALDHCPYVDTWYIEKTKVFPPKADREKNLIVASNSDKIEIDGSDDDGPGETNGGSRSFFYDSCDQVPLPVRVIEIFNDDDPDDKGDGDNDINIPQK